MNDNDYSSGNHRRKFDSVSKILLGTLVFSLIGGFTATIGYKYQKVPNYDIWTHALNGCLTGGVIGIIALLVLYTQFWKQK